MSLWIVVALSGVGFAVAGLVGLMNRYRRGEVRKLTVVAVIAGFLSFGLCAFVNAVRPDIATGPVTVAILLPAFVAIVILVREQSVEHDATLEDRRK